MKIYKNFPEFDKPKNHKVLFQVFQTVNRICRYSRLQRQK